MDAVTVLPSSAKHLQFICWYIAFNALYGIRQYEGSQEENRLDRKEFLKRLRVLHSYDRRYGNGLLVWSKNSSSLAVSEMFKYCNADELIEGIGMVCSELNLREVWQYVIARPLATKSLVI